MENKNTVVVYATLVLLLILQWANASERYDLSKLLEISGINKQVQQFPNMLSEGFVEGFSEGMTITEQQKSLLIQDINAAFDPAEFLNHIEQQVKQDVNTDDIILLMQWYQSGLGKRFTKAEEQASTDQAYNTIMSQAIDLMKDTKRLEMAKRIESLLNSTDQVMLIQNKIIKGITSSLASAFESEDPEDEGFAELMDEEYTDMQDTLKAGLMQLTYASFIYTYQDFDDEELQQYEEFMSTKAFQQFNKGFMTGLGDGFDQATVKLVDKLSITIEKIIDATVSQSDI